MKNRLKFILSIVRLFSLILFPSIMISCGNGKKKEEPASAELVIEEPAKTEETAPVETPVAEPAPAADVTPAAETVTETTVETGAESVEENSRL